MPLINSSSPQAFRQNVSTEVSAGKPVNQALAIAFSQKRKNRAKGIPQAAPVQPMDNALNRFKQGSRSFHA